MYDKSKASSQPVPLLGEEAEPLRKHSCLSSKMRITSYAAGLGSERRRMFDFLAQSTYYEASKVLSTFKRKPGAGMFTLTRNGSNCQQPC